MRKQLLTFLVLAILSISNAYAASVKVTMNTISTTMKLANKSTGEAIDVGTPANRVYTFDAPAGSYVLTGYATNGTTENGTIVINITEDGENDFSILTCTSYATNSGWKVDQDYTVEVEVNSKEGEKQEITIGNSITAGRKTFLALNGNSYYAYLRPSESRQAEGYMELFRSATLTFNVNVSGAIPMGADYTVTVPSNAEFYLGTKTAHFIAFRKVEPLSVETSGSSKKITYHLADNTQYNYRTWKKGGLTQAGYFTMNTDESKRPDLLFTDKDYSAFGPNTIKHDVQWNGGYETGDIFVNVNERGHLRMNVGDTFNAHAMRTWELTDNSTNNYFMEPDFHYTVIDVNGKASKGVIEIENPDGGPDPWTTIKAVGNGTAIVLVTYDAIGVNYYSQKTKNPYMGGEFWSAIWPENTAAYVVTVGGGTTSMDPNMVINEAYNLDTKKLAGKYVDAEHDVFYYLDTEEGYTYTFTPSGVANVEIAYPTIGKHSATYKGFATTGVTKNQDGSYSLLLKEGRQIIRLTDASGNAIYQVLTAKKCHREITNVTREGSSTFIPGDKVKIQYSGLRHPANKMAGIYNMSAYITYNGIPNGTSLILGAGQYTFGSVASAQAVTITIPEDHDVNATPEIVMNDGVIQVNGFGDPIGNHRNTSRVTGRSANFTAIAHKTYFGAIPEVRIPLMAATPFVIHLEANADDVEYTLTRNGVSLSANEDGTYTGTYGDYELTASKAGYRYFRSTYTIEDGAEGDQTFYVELEKADDKAWDGKSKTEPEAVDGIYQISNAAELAWFADHVNGGQVSKSAVLVADIDLADYPWTPIGGGTTSKAFKGNFDGNDHSIDGLYINNTSTYQGLFGYVHTGTVKKLTVSGEVSAKQYVGGISGATTQNAVIDSCVNNVTVQSTGTYLGGITGQITNNAKVTNCVNNAEVTGKANYVGGITANIAANCTVDRCANNGDVKGAGNYVGGIAGYVAQATSTLSNCYNIGDVESTAGCAGIAGSNQMNAVITNVYNIGKITGKNVASCVGGTTAKNNVTKVYSVDSYDITTNQTNVTIEQVANGNLAHLLGEPFGQDLENDNYPVIGGPQVYKVTYTTNLDSYVNTLYSNATLTTTGWVDNRTSTWYTKRGGEVITEIDCDCTLYVELLTSGIKDTVALQDMENGERYNLAGQRVDKNYKGVVIINGKKYIIK